MGTRYVEPQSNRFFRERVDGVEQLRIPFRRNWFILIFFAFWLTGWTVGGIAAAGGLAMNLSGKSAMAGAGAGTDAFMGVWLIFWAFGWVFVATSIALQLAGSEIIRIVGRDLEISTGVGRWRRRKLYRGDQIRELRSSDPNPLGWALGSRTAAFPGFNRAGAIKFDYGARTIRAASSVDEAEGRMIVDWLKSRLPSSATGTTA